MLSELDIASLMQAALERGQTVCCRVKTESMSPCFRVGDLLEVDGQRPCEGEVAVFLKDGEWVTHRVLAIHRDAVVTRGDNRLEQELITHEQIVGRVTAHKRDARARLIGAAQRGRRFVPGPVRRILPEKMKKRFRRWALADETRIRKW